MNGQPNLVVNGIDFITSKWQVINYSNIKFCGLQNNAMHVLNHSPTYYVYLMHFGVLFKIQKIK
jgi:hypothetical protein